MGDAALAVVQDVDGVRPPERALLVVVPGVQRLHGEGGGPALAERDLLHRPVVPVAVAAQHLVCLFLDGPVSWHAVHAVGVQDDGPALGFHPETGVA